MNECACPKVGIDPSYGRPGNHDAHRLIPGDTCSGAAVSVGEGAGVDAIGSDTGG